MSEDTNDIFLKAMACFKLGKGTEGAELLRKASSAGHAEAQNQLSRLYFASLKEPKDLGDLELQAQSGDNAALLALAMCLLEGRLVDKDNEKAVLTLKHAAERGNYVAQQMLSQQARQA